MVGRVVAGQVVIGDPVDCDVGHLTSVELGEESGDLLRQDLLIPGELGAINGEKTATASKNVCWKMRIDREEPFLNDEVHGQGSNLLIGGPDLALAGVTNLEDGVSIEILDLHESLAIVAPSGPYSILISLPLRKCSPLVWRLKVVCILWITQWKLLAYCMTVVKKFGGSGW